MLVHQIMDTCPADSVFFHGETEISYGELNRQVNYYRNCLYQQGVRSGEPVGLLSRNCVEYIYSYMAIVSLGAVAVPINFQLTTREITYIIGDARIRMLVTREAIECDSAWAKLDEPDLYQVLIPELAAGQITADDAPALPETFGDEQPCVIIYTSGTTGNPKGAVLTHRNLVSNAYAFKEMLPVYAADNVLCVLPMYHCFSWTCAVLNTLACGASISILDGFTPKETLLTIQQKAVSVMYGVPPIYNFLLRAAQKEELAGMRLFVSGGAALPEKVAEGFKDKFGQQIIEGYGLSEASPVVTLNPAERVKYCSIGKALPGLTLRIIGSRGEALGVGEIGELTVTGPSVMQGYYNLPLDTSRALRDGWLHTGDLAYQDEEGYYFVVDRLKDMIITNGENIYPREIEELLYAFPGVVEAAVVGVEDELRGQAVCAYLVASEDVTLDKKAIKEYLQGNLAAYKMPRDYIQVDALPKIPTGKILKRVLRARPAASVCDDERAG